jgi:hypothetical protein
MTEKRQMDAFAASIYGDRVRPTRADRWKRFKRIGLPVLAVTAIVVAIAVVTDIPQHQTLASERVAAASLVDEVNSDIGQCTYAMNEATTIYRRWVDGNITASDRSEAPGLLSQDADGCSFTSDNIYNLASIEQPGTGAGKYLSNVVGLAVQWTSGDALAVMEDFGLLIANPHDSDAVRYLHENAIALAADRKSALTAIADAERYLHGQLPRLKLPAESIPGT